MLVVLVVGYGGWRVVQDRFFDHLPQGTEAYAGGGGVTYAPAGHHYQVRLPVPPVESTASDTVDGQVYTAYNALIERLPDGWEMAVGTVAIGPRPGLTDEVLDEALLSTATGMAAAANATTKRAHDDHPRGLSRDRCLTRHRRRLPGQDAALLRRFERLLSARALVERCRQAVPRAHGLVPRRSVAERRRALNACVLARSPRPASGAPTCRERTGRTWWSRLRAG